VPCRMGMTRSKLNGVASGAGPAVGKAAVAGVLLQGLRQAHR
jgi:hypothetical protein